MRRRMTFPAEPAATVGSGPSICAWEPATIRRDFESELGQHSLARLDWRHFAHHGRRRASQDFQAMAWAFMLSVLFGDLELWLGPPEPDAWISEQIVFPILVMLNVITLLGLIGTLKSRAKTSPELMWPGDR